MAEKKENVKSLKVANISSVAMVFFMSGAFIFEALYYDTPLNYSVIGLIMIMGLMITISVIRNTINTYKLAFNVPFVLLVFYTTLMIISNWHSGHYLLFCTALCAISCIYSSFNRSLFYILFQNVVIAVLVLRGSPVSGHEVSFFVILINWTICLFGSIIMLLLTRYATIVLDRALEHQNSFNDLLATTENFVALIDERNEVVYASKSLSDLGNIGKPELAQGRPLIDLFPGKSLKIYAGNLLKEKDNYAEDWEFFLNGQKRYFKAASHRLAGIGTSSGSLISLYDMTHLAERDEIAAMKDSMKIGLFFMDKNYIIQDHYSRYLEVLFMQEELFGKAFTDVIADSVTPSELEATKDYFNMVLEGTYDQEMLEDINPLNELHYTNKKTGDKKVFSCEFNTVERGHGEMFILVTVYDITLRVELQQRLAEEEARRQEEMQSVFELIQVDPNVFNDFMADVEIEFDTIDKILKNEEMTAHEVLVKVYQSVHAIKSNAVILGLNVFGNKVHNLESKIKVLREHQGEVPFTEMLNLTMDIEKVSQERENFKDVIEKLHSYTGGGGIVPAAGGENQNVKVLVESLAKAASRAAEDLEKKIKFIANEVDPQAVSKAPRRIMKEVLTQLVRNSAVHGIEPPDERKAKGKNETGIIKLTIILTQDKKNVHIKVTDDGKGLDYRKIAQRAVKNRIIKPEMARNKDVLMKAIFAPGFSTADKEGVHGGRGIGLNLVRDRIKEAGGAIKLKTVDNKGTVFFVSLPVEKA